MILQAIEAWKASLRKSSGTEPDRYIDEFLADTNFVAAVKSWAPNLLEEVNGLGEGAGVDSKVIFAYQCTDEDYWYRAFEKRFGAESLHDRSHCSVIGCFDTNGAPPLLGQNMDIPNFYDGFQILMHIKDRSSSVESYVFTVAGLLELCGLNNQPIGICCNTLPDLNHARDGLPVTFIVRRILESSTLDEAKNFIEKIKHASGQSYMVADAHKVVDFECSGNKVCQFTPHEGAHRLYHTNHALLNDDKRASDIRINQMETSSHQSKIRLS